MRRRAAGRRSGNVIAIMGIARTRLDCPGGAHTGKHVMMDRSKLLEATALVFAIVGPMAWAAMWCGAWASSKAATLQRVSTNAGKMRHR